jgi:hypothetical protein
MSKPVVTTLILLTSTIVVSLIASCAVTRTVTVTNTGPGTTMVPTPITMTVTVQNTITTTIQGVVATVTLEPVVYTPIFERVAPEVPHRYIIDMPHTGLSLYECEGDSVCFVCHPLPVEHQQWLYDSEICEDCHRVSKNPLVTPNVGYGAVYP